MYESETYDQTQCLQCGASISIARDRAYPLGDDEALCFSCALARGGRYDDLHDRWTAAPSVKGLPLAEQARARAYR
jgi:hypothetical protein